MSSTTSSSSLLLCVLVKSAKIENADNEKCTYVVLKIDNVKSTTTVVKGFQPIWEQEFYFDIPYRSSSLQIELWERGQFWDKRLGLTQIRFDDPQFDNYSTNFVERWIDLDVDSTTTNRIERNFPSSNENSTKILIRTYVEFPSDLTEEESKELTEKLEILHEILDKEGRQLQDVTFDELNSLSTMHSDQQFPQQFQQLTRRSQSHFSDDSDYTSDVSYPINSQANVNYPLTSMSQSNVNYSSPQTKKPLAFVQPVIRNVSRRSANDQIDEPLSYVSQPRKTLVDLTSKWKSSFCSSGT